MMVQVSAAFLGEWTKKDNFGSLFDPYLDSYNKTFNKVHNLNAA